MPIPFKIENLIISSYFHIYFLQVSYTCLVFLGLPLVIDEQFYLPGECLESRFPNQVTNVYQTSSFYYLFLFPTLISLIMLKSDEEAFK